MNTCGARREADPTNKWKAHRRRDREPFGLVALPLLFGATADDLCAPIPDDAHGRTRETRLDFVEHLAYRILTLSPR